VNVFVTGGAGYIGSVCVEELLNLGYAVTVFDNCSEGHRQAIDPRARFIEGNLNEPASILAAVSSAAPEAIMHFAANALVGESMENPYKYFHNNVYGGLNLLRAAVEAGVKRFVFSSTCATYGIPERVPIDEETPQHPINPYGESKLMFERMLRWFDQIHGIKYVALRYFNAAGASERFGEHHRIETHLIPRILAVALGHGQHAEIFGTDYPTPDGTCIRDYIHIYDLAQAHILARSMSPSHWARDSCGRETAPAGRSSSADRRVSESPESFRMDTEISGHSWNREKRLGMARKASEWLFGITPWIFRLERRVENRSGSTRPTKRFLLAFIA
jgi:UDP-glucose 4-epimerase